MTAPKIKLSAMESSASRSVLFTSFVRTVVPVLAGGGLGHLVAEWLTWLGFDVNQGVLERGFELVFFGVYYLVARFLETHRDARWGWLLGRASVPTYAGNPPPAIGPGAGPGDTDVATVAVPVIVEEDGEPVELAAPVAPVKAPAKKAAKKVPVKRAPAKRTRNAESPPSE